ncbi:hypothetical protein B0T18DRAFT_401450 [Schizothecium vesticola]|uniref:Uncharacterized protein n=1 Tax=Schizothecium vesticola TaxID=314040 RepID=A0AA40F4W9_9PEZI|nr:hypothetical protein B0T18DRAFT_401450 [Schizothecium vesticola]
MAVHGGTARDCGALWQAGTAATRTICRGERGGGGDERELGTCWGGSKQSPDRRRTTDDDRRPAGGKRRVSLSPGSRSGSVWWKGGLWPGRQVADVADLAAAAAAAAAARTGRRGTDGGRGVGSVLVAVAVDTQTDGRRAYVLDRETEGREKSEDRRLQSWCTGAVCCPQPKAGLTTLSLESVSWLECGPTGQHQVCRVQRPNVS